MSLNLKNIVGNIFHTEDKEKEEEEKKVAEFQQMMNRVTGNTQNNQTKQYNPFLKKDGTLFNPMLNYQKLLDSPNISNVAKKYITQATGLSQTQKETPATSTTPTTTNYTPSANSQKIGFISAKYEAGGRNGGTVDPGKGDHGGVSYGIPQFSTTTGSADGYVAWLKQTHPEMGNYFGNYKAGTAEFSQAWQKVYETYGDSFSDTQTNYAYQAFVVPLAKLAKEKTGIDYTRSSALTELLYSTAIQFGAGSLAISALGNVNANMSDTEIVNASYDNKIANYKSYFSSSSADVQESVRNRFVNERNDVLALIPTTKTSTPNTGTSGSSPYSSKVGKVVADISKPGYKNNAALGQCVWYVRGRANEKLGITLGSMGNGNEMWYNAKSTAKVAARPENLKANMLVSYKYGTSAAGQKYGHVIYIEDVVGDTVYYTEGGSGYYKNGTVGLVKTATRQGIINGVNTSGGRMGSNVIGFIDLSKY